VSWAWQALAALLIVAKSSIPAFSAPVVDAAGVVPDDVERRVAAALLDYQTRSGNQVAVAVVKSTGDESIEDYTIDLAREWGVGQKGADNGVVLVIAYEDRKLRIEVGRGLEGTLTDLQSGRLIREQIVPRLRAGDVGGAVEQGAEGIRRELGDDQVGPAPPTPAAPDEEPSNGVGALGFIVPLAIAGLVLSRRLGRGGGWGSPIFWGGGYSGSGWGGSGGGSGGGFGGGFGGGGGGGFGGGGASGSW
jgi:uncharacterized protein